MKNNKLKRVLALLLVVVMAIPSSMGGVLVKAADDEKFLFFDGSNYLEGAQFEFKGTSTTMDLSLKNKKNETPTLAAGGKIKYSTAPIEVAKVESSDSAGIYETIDATLKVDIKGPGSFILRAQFKDDKGKNILVEQTIVVKLNVDRAETAGTSDRESGFKQILGLDPIPRELILKEPTGAFDPTSIVPKLTGGAYKINLVSPMTNNSRLVDWKVKDASIAEVVVDGTNGENVKIVPKRGGVTEVTAMTTKYSPVKLSDTFKVFVQPKLSLDNVSWYTELAYDSANSGQNEIKEFSSYKQNMIYTNGVFSTGEAMSSIVQATTVFDKDAKEVADTKNILNIESQKENYMITNSKAGIYNVTFIPNLKGTNIARKDLVSATSKIKIPLSVNKDVLTQNMNTGDSYILSENSNVQDASQFEVSTADKDIIEVDPATNKLKALKRGNVEITVKLKKEFNKMYGIPDNDTYERKIKFTVIDGFSLNYSEVYLNVKKTIDLKITSANSSSPITWESSDKTIATVEPIAGTKNAKVTGVKQSDKPITITVSQNIDGITKEAKCIVYVVNAVESITLSPPELDLKIGKTEMITAEFLPKDVGTADLKWVSTNPEVADFKTIRNGVAIIEGKKAGDTIVMAISKENTVISNQCKVTIKQDATDITLDATSKVVYIGESTKLKATLVPANADASGVKWSSANTAIATVDNDGNVKGVAVGQTVVMVRTADGKSMRTCTIYVKKKATGITLDVQDITLNKGSKYKIPYKTIPADANDIELVWSSMNKIVADVSGDGVVTAKEKGSTIIMAQTKNGEVVFCNVTVQEPTKGMTLNYSEKTLVRGKSFTLRATILPVTAKNPGFIWKSSNKKVATVSSNGTVKANKGGTAIITCTSKDKKYTKNCIITVTEYATKVKMSKTSITLGVKKSYNLKAKVSNASTTNKKVTWKSTNKKIATVSSSGKVIGKKKGYCTIIATARDGSGHRASCKVRVVTPATKIKLNRSEITMLQGKSYRLKATISPKKATIRSVSYSSDNKKVATVAGNGMVRAINPGIALIKVTTRDNSKKTAYCYVNVIENIPSTGVTLSQQDIVMVQGDRLVLQKNIQPANTTDKVSWSTDNSAVVSVSKTTGKVIAKSPGIANVTVFTSGGKYATTKITVVGLNKTRLTLQKYTNYQLQVIGMTSNITWNVDNPSVVTVTANGTLTTHNEGQARVYAYVNGCTLSCIVTVTKIR